MTREEREQALEWFKNRPITMSGAKKMYDLAFEALSADGDAISRQAAIDLVEGLESAWLKGEIDLLYPKVVKGLIGLPSAQPERKTGRWIKISPAGIYECSECGQNVMTCDIDCYVFCHGCGAYMKGEPNED